MTALAYDERTFVGELTEHEIQARVRVLRVIAERYTELVSPLNGPGGIRGDGDSLSFMPPTYTASVREFERLLTVMREDRAHSLIHVGDERVSVRRLRWHVVEFYVNAESVTRHFPVKLKRGSKLALIRDVDGQPVTTRPVTRVRRHPEASQRLADAGLAWIATHWARETEPMLLEALRDAS